MSDEKPLVLDDTSQLYALYCGDTWSSNEMPPSVFVEHDGVSLHDNDSDMRQYIHIQTTHLVPFSSTWPTYHRHYRHEQLPVYMLLYYL